MALQPTTSRSLISRKLVGAFVAIFALFIQPLVALDVPSAFAAPVVNEVMPRPIVVGADNEWIELRNTGTEEVDLEGITLDTNGPSSHTFGEKTIDANGLFVVCKTADAAPVCNDIWAGMTLANTGDTVVLKDGSTVLDDFSYMGADVEESESIEVVRQNGIKTGVNNATNAYGESGNHGTPGAINLNQPTVTAVTNTRTGMVYDDLQTAVDDAQADDTLRLNENLEISSDVDVTKSVTIDGDHKKITGDFVRENGSNNSVFSILADNVTVKNITVEGVDSGENQLHGINVYESVNVTVENVTARNFRTGILYNGSTGTINGVITENNEWHGINVDKSGSNVTVIGANAHDEGFADIYVDDEAAITAVNAVGYNWERSGRPNIGRDYSRDRVYRLMSPSEACNGSTFDSGFNDGSVNGQNGWRSTGGFDQAIVSNVFGFAENGCKSLRISNAVTSGAFGNQTFSPAAANRAGESTVVANGMSHYEAEFTIASAKQSYQPGLFLSVSPDRGDGSRMSYLGFADTSAGIDVTFYDVQGTGNPANFQSTTVASGLSRSTSHLLLTL